MARMIEIILGTTFLIATKISFPTLLTSTTELDGQIETEAAKSRTHLRVVAMATAAVLVDAAMKAPTAAVVNQPGNPNQSSSRLKPKT
ncbi:hypothetical protein K3555_23640 (plasmid) [Leisingera sp. M527]|uniref:hypothetical protein n=1 Tax=Leisingera sp. M527 TaxID=2867014 RepID=UPI0021A52ACA|nr:hypothetical protein [Leisingera sp. M527]UWQ35490.1 hypothetical protein K3555_23640 [Leisingera sp. M527]